jgi:hypothetical protein
LISRKAVTVVVAAVVLAWALSAEANGLWKAQIVDAETGRPLEGVVVLAIWTARSPGEIHPHDEFHDVDEVVSDSDGRIVIPARGDGIPSKPRAVLRGPRILMFKAGYGRWGFRDVETRRAELKDAYAREEAFDREWAKFAGEGVVIVLPPTRTPEGRRRAVYDQSWTGVPRERIQRFLQELDTERAGLGLGRE